MSTLKRKSENNDDNLQPIKKRKLDKKINVDISTIDLTKVYDSIVAKCKVQDDHLIWQNRTKTSGSFPAKYVQGVKLRVQRWLYSIKHKSFDQMPNTMLRSYCNVEDCVSHHIPITLNLEDLRKMTSEDKKYMMSKLERHSEISNLPTENKLLTTPCRLYKTSLGTAGYGKIYAWGNQMAPGKLMLYIRGQELRDGEECRHICRNTNCFEHVEPGTSEDNNGKDKKRDGTLQFGEKHYYAKLNDKIAREIFLSRASGKSVTQRMAELKVTHLDIYHIDRGQAWKHVYTDFEMKEMNEKFPVKVQKKSPPLTQEEIVQILECQEKGIGIKKCSKQLELTFTRVDNVYKGKTTVSNFKDNTKELMVSSYDKSGMTENAITKYKNHYKSLCDVVDDEKFESHWIFKLKKNVNNYGEVSFRGNNILAHRINFLLYQDYIRYQDNDIVEHKCRRTDCINPDHLEIGTLSTNQLSRVRDGTDARGEKSITATISNETAMLIKNSKGEGRIIDRAKKFDVTWAVVKNIDDGKTWKILDELDIL